MGSAPYQRPLLVPPANHDPSTAAQHPRCQPAAGLEISQISQKPPLLRPAPNAPSHFILTGLKFPSPRLQLLRSADFRRDPSHRTHLRVSGSIPPTLLRLSPTDDFNSPRLHLRLNSDR